MILTCRSFHLDGVVALIPSNEANHVAEAWLRAYLGGLSELRRGVLRQAVVLQIKNGATSVLLDVEGINGMVPNQVAFHIILNKICLFRPFKRCKSM